MESLPLMISTTVFLQLLGKKLKLSQHCRCIATAYFHRFCQFDSSFNEEDAKNLVMAVVHLAGKAHHEFRELEHVIKAAYACMDQHSPALDAKSELFSNIRDEVLILENVLLKVIGFRMNVELPHPDVIKICEMIGGKELAKRSYHLATASIMVSTLCLQYKPVTIACVCVNLAARWSQLKINSGTEKNPWFSGIVSAELLNELTDELEDKIFKGARLVDSPLLNGILPLRAAEA